MIAASTPFYGTKKDGGDIVADTNTHIGTVGGAKAWLWDRPRATTPQDSSEFISTATEMSSGRQLDAIRWGFNANYSDLQPEIVLGSDPGLVGRDRAIDTWNENVAENEGEGVPLEGGFNPTDAAQMLNENIKNGNTSAVAMTLTNSLNTKGDHRARVKANYRVETGKELWPDVEHLFKADAKKYTDWK